MRSYGQYCALARALDVVGDRWTLLIVRELLAREPCRYTDLAYGLPGIATNLLVERLRQLEDQGLVARELAPPPIATTVYRLTDRGKALSPAVFALGEWGEPLLGEPVGASEFRTHWLTLPLEANLCDHAPDEPPVTIELRTGDQPMVIETADGGVRARPGRAAEPDVVLSGDPSLVIRLLIGKLDLASARARGLAVEGNVDAIRRVQPAVVASPVKARRTERVRDRG